MSTSFLGAENFSFISSGSGGGGGGGTAVIILGTGAGSSVRCGNSNNSFGACSTALGFCNASCGAFSSVVGGTRNTAGGVYSTITGGICGTVSGDYGGIFSGSNNNITANYGFIGSGSVHTVGVFSAVVNGFCNTASNYSSILGGGQNVSSGCYSSIGSGTLNNVSGNYGFIGSGQCNTSCGIAAFTGSGFCNTASGACSGILGGTCNIACGQYSVITGGLQAFAYLHAQQSNSSGQFSAVGDAQSSFMVARRQATLNSSGTAKLSLDGTGTTGLIIPNGNNRSWNVFVDWVIVCTVLGTGTSGGLAVGGTHTGTDAFYFIRVGGTSSISAQTNLASHNTSGMASSNITFAVGAAQDLQITLVAPSSAGTASTFRAVVNVRLVEVAW